MEFILADIIQRIGVWFWISIHLNILTCEKWISPNHK